MTRQRLKNRRPNETIDVEFDGVSYAICIGYYTDDGRPGEIFSAGAKVGSSMDALLDDVSIALSLLLQNGVKPAALAKTMGRLGDGRAPASIIGAICDLLAEQAPEPGGEVNESQE